MDIEGTITGRWFDKKNPHEHIFSLVKYLEESQSYRRNKNLMHARLYSNSELLGLESASPLEAPRGPIFADREERIRLNVIASVVDTISSKIAKNKPKVVMLPSGGDFNLQQRAKKLEKFVSGVFYQADIHEEGIKAFLDCCIFGTGVIKIFQENGNVCAERVIPSELIVDDEEAFRGKPRQMHQRREVSREVLMEMFPESKKDIKTATKLEKHRGIGNFNSVADNVTVIESWHLASGPDAKDGKHIISVDTAVLLEEDYDCDDFPFVFLRWKRSLVGFWGIGIAEDITGIQVEINKLLMKIQQSFHHLSNPMIFLHQSSNISKAHINNKIGIIVPYTGNPPIIRASQTVHPEVFAHLERLYARAFEIVGVSQMSATSRKPEGLDSGAAIREYNDIESERFALVAQTYEQMFVKIAGKVIGIAEELYEDEGDLEVTVKGRQFIETIKWSEVKMEDDQFALTVGAGSSLPQTKAGRVQRATEWYQAGIIDGQEWRELLDIPDLEDATELQRAPRDYVRRVVSDILSEGIFTEPEARDNLDFAMEYATLSYQRAKLDGVPDENIELLINYIDAIEYLVDQAIVVAANEQAQLNEYTNQMAGVPNPKVPTNPLQGNTMPT